jgi:hypothetical protein
MPKPFAFVLMPFDKEFTDTYKLGIKPACEEAGYYCERLDDQIFEETMLERIYNQISKADLIVADMTGKNANVFYETGYAHALEKRVILLTRVSNDIPFDLKHHFHIVYSNGIAALKDELTRRARYYISHPSVSNHNPFAATVCLVNGENLDPSADTIDVSVQLNRSSDGKNLYFPINVAFHLPEICEEDVEIALRLLTPNPFSSCGWYFSGGITQTFTSIKMPDGGWMHKPLSNIRLTPGDGDTVNFDVDYETIESDVVFLLRMSSSGFRRDVKLRMTYSG